MSKFMSLTVEAVILLAYFPRLKKESDQLLVDTVSHSCCRNVVRLSGYKW